MCIRDSRITEGIAIVSLSECTAPPSRSSTSALPLRSRTIALLTLSAQSGSNVAFRSKTLFIFSEELNRLPLAQHNTTRRTSGQARVQLKLSEVPEALLYLGKGHAKGKVVITLEHNSETWQSAAPKQCAARSWGNTYESNCV